MRPDVLADHLGQTIRGVVGPLALRVAELEAARASFDLPSLMTTVADVELRLRALETRAPVAGPPGPEGPAGPPGAPGADGKDGRAVTYLGAHVAGKTYDPGDVVSHDGSAWYCHRTTTGGPGQSKDWQLMVKRGRDLRDPDRGRA